MAEYIERIEALAIVDLHHGARQAYHKIRNLSAADVAPVVHGRWVRLDDGDYGCSVCGYESIEDFTHCPNCGARMDGAE